MLSWLMLFYHYWAPLLHSRPESSSPPCTGSCRRLLLEMLRGLVRLAP